MAKVLQLPTGCTCGGTIWTDSMCVHCLKETERRIVAKIDELEQSIQPIKDRIDELDSDLDIIRWHIENPLCPGGCGENTAHCQCDTE